MDLAELSWRPGIGDPTVGGWITVALYAVAVVGCSMTARWLPPSRERRIWQFIGLLLLALGINKQLDLQTAFTEIGRLVAVHGGWYDNRQVVQLAFIKAAAAICTACALALIYWAWSTPVACWLALWGTIIILGFVLIRAASFHHVDAFLSQSALGLRWNWILEMGGISVVILGSIWRRLSDRL